MTPDELEAEAVAREQAQADAEFQAKTPAELRAMAAASREADQVAQVAAAAKLEADKLALSKLSRDEFEARWKAEQDAIREAERATDTGRDFLDLVWNGVKD